MAKNHKNPRDRHRSPATGAAPDAKGSVRLYGLHAVMAALVNAERRCQRLWLVAGDKNTALDAALDERKRLGLPALAIERAERPHLDKLCPGAVHQGAVLECAPLPEWDVEDLLRLSPLPDILVLLDQVTDPHNVGAILRSAAAFGAGAMIVTERHAPNETGVLAKTASGALEHVPLVRAGNLARAIEQVKDAGYWVYGLDEAGPKTPAQTDLRGLVSIVLGAEGAGLRRLTKERCHALLRLPTAGPIGALNVSNAAAVMLYELKRQRSG